jgi:hypothetical protein
MRQELSILLFGEAGAFMGQGGGDHVQGELTTVGHGDGEVVPETVKGAECCRKLGRFF